MSIRTRSVAPLLALLAVGSLLVACGSSDARAGAAGSKLEVRDVTVDRPALPEQAAVRLVVHNPTATDDTLTAVSSPVARAADIHRSSTDSEGRSVMEPVGDLDIPPRSDVTFEPGGLHVMLRGIARQLELGDEVRLTFTFAHAGRRTVTAEVVEPGSGTEHDHD